VHKNIALVHAFAQSKKLIFSEPDAY